MPWHTYRPSPVALGILTPAGYQSPTYRASRYETPPFRCPAACIIATQKDSPATAESESLGPRCRWSALLAFLLRRGGSSNLEYLVVKLEMPACCVSRFRFQFRSLPSLSLLYFLKRQSPRRQYLCSKNYHLNERLKQLKELKTRFHFSYRLPAWYCIRTLSVER
jgi:hypothetical protein